MQAPTLSSYCPPHGEQDDEVRQTLLKRMGALGKGGKGRFEAESIFFLNPIVIFMLV